MQIHTKKCKQNPKSQQAAEVTTVKTLGYALKNLIYSFRSLKCLDCNVVEEVTSLFLKAVIVPDTECC